MIGDKRLEMPKSYKEAFYIHKLFGICAPNPILEEKTLMKNAASLVKINNEVYEKLEKEDKKIQSLFESINRLEDELDDCKVKLGEVYAIANNVLYLNDRSDYKNALWEILRTINPNLEEWPTLKYIDKE